MHAHSYASATEMSRVYIYTHAWNFCLRTWCAVRRLMNGWHIKTYTHAYAIQPTKLYSILTPNILALTQHLIFDKSAHICVMNKSE